MTLVVAIPSFQGRRVAFIAAWRNSAEVKVQGAAVLAAQEQPQLKYNSAQVTTTFTGIIHVVYSAGEMTFPSPLWAASRSNNN